jgi:hypothetical protein
VLQLGGDNTADGYAANGFVLFRNFLRGCHSRSSGLSIHAIITRSRAGVRGVVSNVERLDDFDIRAAIHERVAMIIGHQSRRGSGVSDSEAQGQ